MNRSSLLLVALLVPTAAVAQAIQAVTNLAAGDSLRRKDEVDRAASHVVEYRAWLEDMQQELRIAATSDLAHLDPDLQREQTQIEHMIEQSDRLLAERDNPEVFRRDLRDLMLLRARMEARANLLPTNSRAAGVANEFQNASASMAATTIPQVSVRIPDVAFVAGTGVSYSERKTLWDVGVSSNMMGTLAGEAFKIVSDAPFAQYLQNNISVGAALPLDGSKRIGAEAGLGLGGLNLGGTTLWPVLSIFQTDSVDLRVPRGLVRAHTDARDWSSPVLSFAFVPFSMQSFDCRVRQGKVVPIIVPALRLPFYYPGNTFDAIAALFTDKRSNYEHSGRVGFSLSISIPLLKVATASPPKNTGDTQEVVQDECRPTSRS